MKNTLSQVLSVERQAIYDLRKRLILEALKANGGNRTNAAADLKMSKSHFYYWLDKLEIGGQESFSQDRRHRRRYDQAPVVSLVPERNMA